MTIRLTPIQEAIVKQAVEQGKAGTAEEFITVALQQMQHDLDIDIERQSGMSIDDINRELDHGLAGKTVSWEGASRFHRKMLKKHRNATHGRRSE